MNAGTYSAVARMARGDAESLRIITQNLAHTSTPGYRRSVAVQGAFDALLAEAAQPGQSIRPGGVAVDPTPGPHRVTDNPLDLTIVGPGFFVLRKGNAEVYTRNGRFSRSPDGTVTNPAGLELQGESGPVRIPADMDMSRLTIDARGRFRAGERTLPGPRVVEFARPQALQRLGPILFAAPPDMQPERSGQSAVINRTLEGSNVSVFAELTDLISCTRFHEACQRMIKAHDRTESRAISQHLR